MDAASIEREIQREKEGLTGIQARIDEVNAKISEMQKLSQREMMNRDPDQQAHVQQVLQGYNSDIERFQQELQSYQRELQMATQKISQLQRDYENAEVREADEARQRAEQEARDEEKKRKLEQAGRISGLF